VEPNVEANRFTTKEKGKQKVDTLPTARTIGSVEKENRLNAKASGISSSSSSAGSVSSLNTRNPKAKVITVPSIFLSPAIRNQTRHQTRFQLTIWS